MNSWQHFVLNLWTWELLLFWFCSLFKAIYLLFWVAFNFHIWFVCLRFVYRIVFYKEMSYNLPVYSAIELDLFQANFNHVKIAIAVWVWYFSSNINYEWYYIICCIECIRVYIHILSNVFWVTEKFNFSTWLHNCIMVSFTFI